MEFEEPSDEDNLERWDELWKLWEIAAEKHLYPRKGSIADLALGARAFRELQSKYPNWRERDLELERELSIIEGIEAVSEHFNFEKLYRLGSAYEQLRAQAELEGDKDFFRRLVEAWSLPDDKIQTVPSLAGIVLLNYKTLFYKSIEDDPLTKEHQTPSKHEIRSATETRRKELGLPLWSDVQWKRVWEDPLILALMRGPTRKN